jgi:hypothetical protein
MRLLIGSLLVLSFVSCTAHTPPDDAVAMQIAKAVEVTVVAMELPAEQRPGGNILASQSRLLACRLTPERVTLLHAGKLDRVSVIDGYNDALKRRAAKQSTAQAPTLLVFLVEKLPQWSIDQTILAAALLAQFEDEAHLVLPTTDLAR